MAEAPSPGPWGEWIGRSIEAYDDVVAAPVERLAALFDHDGAHWPAEALPPLGHWLFTLPDAPQSALGPDGHPARGGFLPPIAQPRRMWAGGRLRFLAPIGIGTRLRRRTTVTAIDTKANGLTFVTLHHAITADGVTAVEEEQDLVYLPIAPPGPAKPVAVGAAESTRQLIPDPTMLFRFSALTFNAHRIHYDRDYARGVELYPDLVVHGPLQAMLLVDHALRDGIVPTRFAFRARAPLHPGTPATLARGGSDLWVRDATGAVTMTASLA
ncbi:MAG TPA: MaoC family dehydratase N-terminal domain-containing protein [Sphingomonas sp.]|jgi:3-methylfumaryl-CoA hydratase